LFAASWPADTRSPRASRVTDELSHAYGSTIVRGRRGAMRKSKGAESGGREEKEELRRRKSVVVRTRQRQGHKEQEWRNAKVRTAVFPSSYL
jgi:hypothetical protein